MEEWRLGPAVGLERGTRSAGTAALARAVVEAALDAGVRLFDSSPTYHGAEQSLGAALNGRGTVATKLWAQSVADGREQHAGQLEWFGRVEIEQIHTLAAWEQQLEWLEEERASGRVAKLGVTDYAPSAFAELSRALRTERFDVVPLPYNPHERECEHELLPLAAELGVDTWAQALLKWALSDDCVDVVILATSKPERTAESGHAGESPWFGPEQRELVERLAA